MIGKNPLLCPVCGEPAVRIPRFYVGGRPLYGCANGHRMVDESDEPSFKGLAPLAPFVSEGETT